MRDTRYQWAYLFGAVCPERAAGAALVMPYADTEAMTRHLEEIAKAVRPVAHAALVLDGADITLIPLPPYAPELNPVENVWEYLRKNKLANRLYETYEDIVDACCTAWNDLMQGQNKSHPSPSADGQRRHDFWRLLIFRCA